MEPSVEPSGEAVAAWSRDEQAASGWVMLDMAHPAHTINRCVIGDDLVTDDAVTGSHAWHGGACSGGTASYGAASVLPLIHRGHGAEGTP